MWVEIYREAGYEEAARATRLSRDSVVFSDTVGDQLGEEDKHLFLTLINRDKSSDGQPHTAGLRQIVFWIGVKAPLYWWKHMDRYSVGKTQASASTMYTLLDRPLMQTDFAGLVNPLLIMLLNYKIDRKDFEYVNRHLPQSFLQERSLMISLPTMRRIIRQRKGHKLHEWCFFVNQILLQARYPELLDDNRSD